MDEMMFDHCLACTTSIWWWDLKCYFCGCPNDGDPETASAWIAIATHLENQEQQAAQDELEDKDDKHDFYRSPRW